MPEPNSIFYIMGVSGTGKTTVGKLLAEELGLEFFDGDDFHPEENVVKMSTGKPLNDNDRKGWLQRLNRLALKKRKEGAVIACSALKKTYRDELSRGLGAKAVYVYLEGTFEEVKARMDARKGHFMPISLLESQFETLEPPKTGIHVRISEPPQKIIQQIKNKIKQ